MTELIYVPSQLDLLAAAVIKRAHLDTRGRHVPGETLDPRTQYEARLWLNDTGRDWLDVLMPTKRAVKRFRP